MLLQPNDICANVAISHSRAYEPRIRDVTDECTSDFRNLLLGLDEPSRCSRFGFSASDAVLAKHAGTAIQRASKVIGIYARKQPVWCARGLSLPKSGSGKNCSCRGPELAEARTRHGAD